ncbi:hypothetical protein PIB30_093848 [Stylosanthes scabra]|uniref:Uncharacterized protein n=1 Tax=Stylosanthes scabra TaxID=79078 RepID=A0ABU6UVE8_9FABA|nr:hypothetical protein [Stylosanthes scabra]
MSSSSSYYHDQHLFRAPHHQEIYKKYIHKKGVTPEKSFELQEGQYPEVGEQIRLRGWRRLSKPRTKISKELVLEFYTNAVRTEEELASGEDYPYTSFVRGTEYLEELKTVKGRQDELWNNTNKFHHKIRKEQDMIAREIQEVKKFQVNQTLMGFQKEAVEKLEQTMGVQQREIKEIKKQLKEWTRHTSSRDAYCCWAHQQANPNLTDIPIHQIPDLIQANAEKGGHIFHGALKSQLVAGSSSQAAPLQPADEPMADPKN